MSDIETFVVSRTGKRPLRFRGELIAVADRGTVTERAQSKFLASFFTDSEKSAETKSAEEEAGEKPVLKKPRGSVWVTVYRLPMRDGMDDQTRGYILALKDKDWYGAQIVDTLDQLADLLEKTADSDSEAFASLINSVFLGLGIAEDLDEGSQA